MIVKDIEDLHLWIICRQVSQMLRAAAEREFARSHLHSLTINVYAHTKSSRMNRYVFSMKAHGLLQIVGDRAIFGATFPRHELRSTHYEPHSDKDRPIVDALRRKALEDSDLDYALRCPYPRSNPIHIEQIAQIGAYYNSIPVPDIEMSVANGTISFPWKPFVNGLLSLHAGARYIHGHENSFTDTEKFFWNNYCTDDDESTSLWMRPTEKAARTFRLEFENEHQKNNLAQAISLV